MPAARDLSSSAELPSAHRLRAAYRAAQAIRDQTVSVAAARASYLRLPTDLVFDVDDLVAGERLLLDVGLLSDGGGHLQGNVRLGTLAELYEDEALTTLLALVLGERPPLWLRTAAASPAGLDTELIPAEASTVLGTLVPDPQLREALLLAAAERIDARELSEAGAAGEEAVVAACRDELHDAQRPDLAGDVQRVSLISDRLGYDVVAPTLDGSSRRLEVKTTRRKARLEVFISRNEATVGLRDVAWALVFCRLGDGGEVEIVGWCRGECLEPLLPENRHARGRWASTAITLAPEELRPGLPPIG